MPADPEPIPTAGPEFPCLSRAERDRRYAAVRARMAARDLGCLIVRADSSKWDAGSSEARYLTHIGGNGEDGYAVFDLEAEPTFVIWGPDHVANWRAIQDWTHDIRPFPPSFAATVAGRVRELGRDRGRIGLVGRLGSRLWRGEGRWPQGNYAALGKELAQATFVDFDEDLWAVMAIKSAEELACVERAMAITEEALGALYAHARPGVRVKEVAGRILGAMVAAGSELGIQLLLSAGPRPPRVAARLFPERVLHPGDVIIDEITAKYLGYYAQAHAPVSVGRSPAPQYERLFAVVTDAIRAGEAILRPGVSTRDLADAVRAPVEKAGYAPNAMPLFKGMGMTIAELPFSPHGVGLGAGLAGATVEENMVLLFEPAAYDEASGTGLHVSEQVVVTAAGYRRLGRAPEFHRTPA
jgi:Xaa-Pro dipeptidase